MNSVTDIDVPDLGTVIASLDGIPRGSRVVAAMSGGVDSSVVAVLLRRLGYDVVGITLQLYDHGAAVQRKGACCAGQDIHDARSVAEAIGIPHFVFDYESRFRTAVIDEFADSYLRGETPIPCVACNQDVKFGDLAAAARKLDAAALVTGHYIRWRRVDGRPALFRAADSDRDQSYFLFATRAADLEFVRFPLGGLSKDSVRRLAADAGLEVAAKPDSQDICFVPGGRYADVIERLRPGAAEPGDIVHVDGRTLGTHKGILHFTVGQRRGIGVATGDALYVVALDATRRRVIVGPRESLLTRRIRLRDFNWLGEGLFDRFVSEARPVYARVRSSQPPRLARVEKHADGVEVALADGEFGVARGQACVIYEDGGAGSRMLGGGWIDGTVASVPLPHGFGEDSAGQAPADVR